MKAENEVWSNVLTNSIFTIVGINQAIKLAESTMIFNRLDRLSCRIPAVCFPVLYILFHLDWSYRRRRYRLLFTAKNWAILTENSDLRYHQVFPLTLLSICIAVKISLSFSSQTRTRTPPPHRHHPQHQEAFKSITTTQLVSPLRQSCQLLPQKLLAIARIPRVLRQTKLNASQLLNKPCL